MASPQARVMQTWTLILLRLEDRVGKKHKKKTPHLQFATARPMLGTSESKIFPTAMDAEDLWLTQANSERDVAVIFSPHGKRYPRSFGLTDQLRKKNMENPAFCFVSERMGLKRNHTS